MGRYGGRTERRKRDTKKRSVFEATLSSTLYAKIRKYYRLHRSQTYK